MKPTTLSPATTQELLGELLVDQASVYDVADRMVAEADRIWASPSSPAWRVVSTSHGVRNEAARVSGVFAPSGVELTRASAVVDASADALFALLASPEGFQLIDPYTDPADHEKPPLEAFDASKWRGPAAEGRRRLEVATALAKVPLLTPREFVVLNAIDYDARYFLSKSVQHARSPGTSAYGPDGPVKPANGTVRALNTFGVQIAPLPEDPQRKCVVQLLNFADMGGKFPAFASNLVNKQFLVAMVERMRKAMAKAS